MMNLKKELSQHSLDYFPVVLEAICPRLVIGDKENWALVWGTEQSSRKSTEMI